MSYLVTGGLGCIGAWTLYHLVRRGEEVICFDVGVNHQRVDKLLSADEQLKIAFVQGDLTDAEQVKGVFSDYDITRVIHLAALQIPFCQANPALGAQVNVTGTIHLFEAARQHGLRHIAYASSVAVYGPPEIYPPGLLAPDARRAPRTLYGAYKVCNEQAAVTYYHDAGLSSVALRPYTVFGVGRDQGLTSEPTKAMHAAANGADYHIPFGGSMQFHYASDVAQQFIDAAEGPSEGAYVFNLGTPPVAVATVADLIMQSCPGATVTVGERLLPFPDGCDPSPLYEKVVTVYETPLEDAIAETIERFRQLSTTGDPAS
ncbi:MAG: GDP-mannose 4,6-dehydratase [Candidatus Promineifilaceae bacterium]|nr:GDP-mannose 4,6-dehydratase [Candidatus Promineifilaceae bacterium]